MSLKGRMLLLTFPVALTSNLWHRLSNCFLFRHRSASGCRRMSLPSVVAMVQDGELLQTSGEANTNTRSGRTSAPHRLSPNAPKHVPGKEVHGGHATLAVASYSSPVLRKDAICRSDRGVSSDPCSFRFLFLPCSASPSPASPASSRSSSSSSLASSGLSRICQS